MFEFGNNLLSQNYLPTQLDLSDKPQLTRSYVYARQIAKTVATAFAGFGVFENIYSITQLITVDNFKIMFSSGNDHKKLEIMVDVSLRFLMLPFNLAFLIYNFFLADLIKIPE